LISLQFTKKLKEALTNVVKLQATET